MIDSCGVPPSGFDTVSGLLEDLHEVAILGKRTMAVLMMTIPPSHEDFSCMFREVICNLQPATLTVSIPVWLFETMIRYFVSVAYNPNMVKPLTLGTKHQCRDDDPGAVDRLRQVVVTVRPKQAPVEDGSDKGGKRDWSAGSGDPGTRPDRMLLQQQLSDAIRGSSTAEDTVEVSVGFGY